MSRLYKVDRTAALEEVQLLWEAADRLLLLIQIHDLGPPGIRGIRENLKDVLADILKEYEELNKPIDIKPRSFWKRLFGG